MDIRQLTYFATIYEEESMTAAAEKLHISQPTLSNQLKILEEELGYSFFERRNRKLFPTEEGKLLYEQAKVLQNNYDSLVQTFHDLKSGNYRTLHMGCINSLVILIFPAIMREYLAQNPGCKLHLFENNTDKLMNLLDEGTIDLCIVKGSFDATIYHSIPLDKLLNCEGDCLAAVGLSKFFKGNEDTMDIMDLVDQPLIVQRTHEALINNAFALHDRTPQIMSSHESIISAMSWSVHNMGISIMPFSSTKLISYVPGGNALQVKKLVNPMIPSQTNLVWRRDHKLNISTQRFIDFIRNAKDADYFL